jgi:predicted nucleic acid-binding protein
LVDKAYLDTSVIIPWLQQKEADVEDKDIKLPKAAQKSINLLQVSDRLNCRFQTSDWALSEMVQYFLDRSIFKKFRYDGYAISSFNRHKHRYNVDTDDLVVINESLSAFEIFLRELGVEIIDAKVDKKRIYHYSLRYSLETADALHIALAENCNYLVTTDDKLIRSGIKEIWVMDPSTLTAIISQKPSG